MWFYERTYIPNRVAFATKECDISFLKIHVDVNFTISVSLQNPKFKKQFASKVRCSI